MDNKVEVQQADPQDLEVKDEKDEIKAPPPLPPRKDQPILAISIKPDDNMSTISVIRQYYVYNSPYIKDNSDLFGTVLSDDSYKSKWLSIRDNINPSDYWYIFLDDSNDDYIRLKEVSKLEENIENGVPDELRGLVYQKVLRTKKVPKKVYDNLLKKASDHSVKFPEKYTNTEKYPSNFQNSYKIIQYYRSEVASSSSTRLDIINSGSANDCTVNDVGSEKFIMNIANYLTTIPSLDEEEVLLILLKIEKLFASFLKPEFFYKTNRTLEDLFPEVFLHITKQGISLNEFHRTCINNFFSTSIKDTASLIRIIDFTIFEGFDFLGRFIVNAIGTNSATIMEKNNDDLIKYLYSEELFKGILIYSSTKINSSIIKYENEYHLIYANSLSNNNNELANLKEVRSDLNEKIKEITHQLEDLNVTHKEILEQNAEFETRTNELLDEKEKLTAERDSLKNKFEELSMEQNLKNTIKANKEFSQRNAELEAQITELKKEVEKKTNELNKYSS